MNKIRAYPAQGIDVKRLSAHAFVHVYRTLFGTLSGDPLVRPQQVERFFVIVTFVFIMHLACADESAMPSYWDHYVGTYPCAGDDQFFHEPAISTALKKALGSASDEYEHHRDFSGCSEIERYEQYLFVDISQLHVGGYVSMILFDPASKDAYIFWLDSVVSTWSARTYGKRPIPESVLAEFVERMNATWGHIATFGIKDGDLAIIGAGKDL